MKKHRREHQAAILLNKGFQTDSNYTRMKKPVWVATETAKGWRLRLDVGEKSYTVKGLLFKSLENMWHLSHGIVHLCGLPPWEVTERCSFLRYFYEQRSNH